MNVAMAYNTADRPRAIEWLEQVRKWDSLHGKHILYLMPAFDCIPIPEIVPFVALTDYLQVHSNWREADGVKHADAAGPNSAFRQVASYFYENKLGAFFWCEPDCCPLKPDCFDKLETEYLEQVSLGKAYLGGFAPAPVPHLNGNLVAPQNAALLATLMLPMRSDDKTRDIAFDVAGAREILPQAHCTNLIQHLWRGPSFTSQEDFDTRIRPDAVFYHQCRDGSLYKYLNNSLAKDDSQVTPKNVKNAGRLCSVKSCDSPAHTKGLCRMHYARLWKNGALELSPPMSLSEKLIQGRRIDEKGCWIWTGGLTAGGYGRMFADGKDRRSQAVHRVAFSEFCGEIPKGMAVCHKCDVRNCFNPEHLFLGTNLDNMRDAAAKGRLPRGERHSAAKLTSDQVIEIREAVRNGASRCSVAKQYECSVSNIINIVEGKTWKSVLPKEVPREVFSPFVALSGPADKHIVDRCNGTHSPFAALSHTKPNGSAPTLTERRQAQAAKMGAALAAKRATGWKPGPRKKRKRAQKG